MYSQNIIDKRIFAAEKAIKRKLKRYSVAESQAVTQHINALYTEKGTLSRDLTSEERDFIENEILMSKCDFLYWATHYAHLQRSDGEGQIGLFELWGSQEILLRKMARKEEEMWARRAAGEKTFDGLCYFCHKARQLGFTLLIQLCGLHRTNFFTGIRGISGSIDDQKTQDVHDRYILGYRKMPPWMQTPLTSKVKDRGVKFITESLMALQDASQDGGFGQGNQWDFAHLTECASWDDPASAIENHFFPTISRSIRSMAFLESTAQGLSGGGPEWWHDATEQARRKRMGRWEYVFIPWYAEPMKNMRYPPANWIPSAETIEHANMVERTSHEFMDGQRYVLTREQMYWYEDEYNMYRDKRTLNIFLTNYCATPEESFQHSGQSAFDFDTLKHCYDQVSPAVPYIIRTRNTPDSLIFRSDRPGAPQPYTIGETEITPVRMTPEEMDDSRGLILVWELPQRDADYWLGVDPTHGITGWTREFRTGDDNKVDNGVIQVFKRGYGGRPDEQVAEYAAPIDPQELATYCNLLGRWYCGRDGDGQAPMIIEIQPGPGAQTQQRLVNEFGYHNFYQWKVFDGISVHMSDSWGWHSNVKSVRELWILGKHHIASRGLITRSKWLVKEMAHCEFDPIKMRGKAVGGQHDDRVSAMLFALWALHDWTTPAEERKHIVTEGTAVEKWKKETTGPERSDMLDDWYASLLD